MSMLRDRDCLRLRDQDCLFPEETGGNEVILREGENVVVLGASTRRGHLVVERNNHTIHVPHHYLELRCHPS